MRSVLPICVGLVVISGGVSASMWHGLRTQKQLTGDLQKQLTEANNRIQTLTLVALRSGTQQSLTSPGATASSDAGTSTPLTPASATRPAAAGSSFSPQDDDAREKEMMKDPDYRKARIAQRRLGMQSNYPGLAEELGLSQTESDRLFDLLIEQQDEWPAKLDALYKDDRIFDELDTIEINQTSMEEFVRRQQPLRLEEDKQVAALLGPGLYAKWKDYWNVRADRLQAISLGKHLVDAGLPLTLLQQRALTAVLAAEGNRLEQQMQPLRKVDQTDPQVSLQLQEQKLRLEDEYNRRVLDAAAASLSSRQISSLRQYYETRSAMISAQNRMAQRNLKAQRSGQASQ